MMMSKLHAITCMTLASTISATPGYFDSSIPSRILKGEPAQKIH